MPLHFVSVGYPILSQRPEFTLLKFKIIGISLQPKHIRPQNIPIFIISKSFFCSQFQIGIQCPLRNSYFHESFLISSITYITFIALIYLSFKMDFDNQRVIEKWVLW